MLFRLARFIEDCIDGCVMAVLGFWEATKQLLFGDDDDDFWDRP